MLKLEGILELFHRQLNATQQFKFLIDKTLPNSQTETCSNI